MGKQVLNIISKFMCWVSKQTCKIAYNKQTCGSGVKSQLGCMIIPQSTSKHFQANHSSVSQRLKNHKNEQNEIEFHYTECIYCTDWRMSCFWRLVHPIFLVSPVFINIQRNHTYTEFLHRIFLIRLFCFAGGRWHLSFYCSVVVVAFVLYSTSFKIIISNIILTIQWLLLCDSAMNYYLSPQYFSETLLSDFK